MLYRQGKEVVELLLGTLPLSELRKGQVLIWQAVRSCFGSGGWINDKPWIDDEGWRNG